ncbi:hypothetical protein DJ55_4194 [Yersinia pseudotuberculosis]|nr:hypothetical protein DJ55_4194 [Yersinia pseudotuberculosis]
MRDGGNIFVIDMCYLRYVFVEAASPCRVQKKRDRVVISSVFTWPSIKRNPL